MNRRIAMGLLIFLCACRDTVVLEPAGASNEAAFVPTGGTAFENFFGGRTEIDLLEAAVDPSAKACTTGACPTRPNGRKLHVITGMGPTSGSDGTFELVPKGPIDSHTPRSATCTLADPDGTSYGACTGTVVIKSAVDQSGHDFGKLEVRIDATVTATDDPDDTVHIRGDALVSVNGVT